MVVHKNIRSAVEFAQANGFKVTKTKRMHLKFHRPGCVPVFTSGTPSDVKAVHNAISNIRRSLAGTL